MKYLVTGSEMKRYDNHTIECIGIPAMVLMERAALAVAGEVYGCYFSYKTRLCVGRRRK